MKYVRLAVVLTGLLGLSSCGLLRSATQLPVRTLKSLGNTVGLGLEHSESDAAEEVEFEVDGLKIEN